MLGEYINKNIGIRIEQPKYKSKIMFGEIEHYTLKTYNRLQKFMWKKCFGVIIENI